MKTQTQSLSSLHSFLELLLELNYFSNLDTDSKYLHRHKRPTTPKGCTLFSIHKGKLIEEPYAPYVSTSLWSETTEPDLVQFSCIASNQRNGYRKLIDYLLKHITYDVFRSFDPR